MNDDLLFGSKLKGYNYIVNGHNGSMFSDEEILDDLEDAWDAMTNEARIGTWMKAAERQESESNNNFNTNMNNMANGIFGNYFGKLEPGRCRLTMNGNVAVYCRSTNSYKTYNVKKQTLTNVTNFCFDTGMDIFFVMPTNKVKAGDIVLIDGTPKCVIETDKKVITVIDFDSSEIKKIVPERHVFMGNTVFYGKIVNLLGNKKGGMSGILKMMMMSKLVGGNTGNTNGGGFGGDLGSMMAMSMMMGKNDMFDGIFDDLDIDEDDEKTLALGDVDEDDDDED